MTRARDLAAFVSNADGDIKFDTDTLFIDSSANRVGIGRTDPAHPLDVDGEVRFNSNIRLTEATSDAETGSINLADSGLMQIQAFATGGEIAFDTGSSATERMRIDGSGRVGIGTASPNSSYKMTIESTASEAGIRVQGDSARIACFENGSATIGDGPNFYMQNVSGGTYAASMQMGASSEILFFQYPNSGAWNERLRIQSGGGISFNGDTSASNALSDYEEGTFSVGVRGSTSSGTATISSSEAKYTKIGRMVHVAAYFNVTNHTGTGDLFITGLPYTQSTSTAAISVGTVIVNNLNWNAREQISVIGSANSTELRIFGSRDNGTWGGIPVDTSFGIHFQTAYFT